jgi:NTP pyrophosphatase (non-canonical NTP hydrolase)
METLTRQELSPPREAHPLAAVLCGSFRRDAARLEQVFEALRHEHLLLSPRSVEWVDPGDDFVRLPEQVSTSAGAIEQAHLDAIKSADFVWLFCPDGYVGPSAALEVGFANAIGVPVLSDCAPREPALAGCVSVVNDASREVVSGALTPQPGGPLSALQRYYERAAERRGWSEESPRDTVLLLTEELGELARAVRVDSGIQRDAQALAGSAAEEIADVQLLLVHLANALGIDLADAVTAKEAINAKRSATRERAA